jgi:hypothetical protein
MACASLFSGAEEHMANDEIRKRGAVTEYRPDEKDVSGGSDKSVQTEALGAEGSQNLPANSATSGGAAGRINDLEPNKTPERDGGLNDNNRGLTR